MPQTVSIAMLGSIVLGLIAVIVLLVVFHRQETRDLRNRLMARDFHDFATGTRILESKPIKSDVEELEEALGGISEEDKEKSKMLPVT